MGGGGGAGRQNFGREGVGGGEKGRFFWRRDLSALGPFGAEANTISIFLRPPASNSHCGNGIYKGDLTNGRNTLPPTHMEVRKAPLEEGTSMLVSRVIPP